MLSDTEVNYRPDVARIEAILVELSATANPCLKSFPELTDSARELWKLYCTQA